MNYLKHSFGSDNHSGIHPRILQAIADANTGYAPAYGEDPLTEQTLRHIESVFGGNCRACFVLNGTGANVLALSCLASSYHAVLCPSTGHIHVDECGAPEKIIQCKVQPMEHENGKVTPETVSRYLTGFGFQHHSQPEILYISQPTELGTVYTPEEIRALADLMHRYGGRLYIDGARLSCAAEYLNLPMRTFTLDAGADACSLGGTKNGLMMGEAVVFSHTVDTSSLLYRRKQMTQLYSKSRFIAAQFEAWLENGLYLALAGHANRMARYLADRLQEIPEVRITRPVQTNVVFACIPFSLYRKLSENHYFYIWDETTTEVRWMCSFSTTPEDIDRFILDIKSSL